MRLHVLWSVLYSGILIAEVICSNVAFRCIAIAVVAIVTYRSLWAARQSWYEYGFDEGKEATLDALSAFAPVAASHQRQQATTLQGESVQDAPATYQPLR